MDIKAYIESGILEQYVLGLLDSHESQEVERYLKIYAELRTELKRVEMLFESYAMRSGVTPPAYVKEQLLDAINNLKIERDMTLYDLPLLHKYSDYKNWLKVTADLSSQPLANDGRRVTVLRHDAKVTQMLLVSTTDIELETHLVEHESFLILEGECKCTVGSKVSIMIAGDYMQIPLFEPHEVQLISPKVTAILQRVSV